MVTSATATPIAATGPRPLVEFVSANARHKRPNITVLALATMAGLARVSATRMAT